MGETSPPTAADWAMNAAHHAQQAADDLARRLNTPRQLTYTANGVTYTAAQMIAEAKAHVLQGKTAEALTITLALCELLVREVSNAGHTP